MKGIFERTKFIDMCMARFFRVAKKKKIISSVFRANSVKCFLSVSKGITWKTNILRCILIQGKVINRESPQTFNFERKSVFFPFTPFYPCTL